MKRGFTVVEVLVTLVIIGILLGLGTVGIRSTLANGRDAERKSDIETIARGFEQRYKNGNQEFVPTSGFSESGTKSMLAKTSYPSALEYKYGILSSVYPKGEFTPSSYPGGKEGAYKIWGFSQAAATAPGGIELGLVCARLCQPAENASQISAAFASPNQDRYVYEPIDADGNICSAEDFAYVPCPRFNLYWISETIPTNLPSAGITGLQIYKGKYS